MTLGSGTAGALSLDLRPRLSPKTKLRLDPKTGKYILLYPEKGLLLNATGAAILKRCTGDQTISAIIDGLAQDFVQDAAPLQEEVLRFLQSLVERGLLRIEP